MRLLVDEGQGWEGHTVCDIEDDLKGRNGSAGERYSFLPALY
jgi:hypothetical protein